MANLPVDPNEAEFVEEETTQTQTLSAEELQGGAVLTPDAGDMKRVAESSREETKGDSLLWRLS